MGANALATSRGSREAGRGAVGSVQDRVSRKHRGAVLQLVVVVVVVLADVSCARVILFHSFTHTYHRFTGLLLDAFRTG